VSCVALLMGLLFCSMAFMGDPTRQVVVYLALFAASFALYLVALHLGAGISKRGLALALGCAVLFRIPFLFTGPFLSDDVYRYVWEGRVQLHGGNPYADSDRPGSPRFASLRDPVYEKMNHKEYGAIYPPFFELVARLVVSVSDSVTAMKVFFLLCEVATWGLLVQILPADGRDRVLIMAWSPLAVTEIAWSAHNEALGLLLLVACLFFLERRRPFLSAAMGALAFQAKLLPGLFCLAWVRRYRFRAVLLGVLVAAVLLVPFLGAGSGLTRSLSVYAAKWRFNATLFPPIEALVGWRAASPAAAGLVALLALTLGLKGVRPGPAGLLTAAAFLLLAPSVLPWYALWLLPFLVLCESRGALLFTGTVVIAYTVYPLWQSTGVWEIPWGMRALEYGPCLLVALMEVVRPSKTARLGGWTSSSSS
jgi:hypothetical protein